MKKTIIMTSALLLCSTLASCSTVNSVVDTVREKLGLGKVKKEVVLPQDREEILKDMTAKTYTPDELRRGVIRGDWAVESVNGRKAVGEETPYLKFVDSEKRVYGNNGCNVLNGAYTYNPADSTLTFSGLLTTMKMCELTGITDIEINAALDNTRRYTVEPRGESQYYLCLYDAAGHRLMELMHQNFDFLNGTWAVAAVNGIPVNIPDMKLVIDVEEGKIHGHTGCNILNGTLETDMETPNSISFSELATTKRMCRDNDMETPLLVALEDATYARPISADKVLLLDTQDVVVLELRRD